MRLLFNLLFLCCPLTLAAQTPQGEQQQKFDSVFRYLTNLYVDEVDSAPLIEEAIRAMLSELDPHSSYLDATEMKGAREIFDGEFSGIGVEFNILRDTVIVVNTISGGPAERVGLLPNDRIVRIDTTRTLGFKQSDVPKYLRGKTGTKVDVEIVRHGLSEPLLFTIVRDKIPINTVDAAYKIDQQTGYIKVNRFGRTTMQEFRKAFHELGKIDGLILDLRGNGGGLLDQAVEMANFFLPQGSVIVSTEGRAIPSSSFTARYNGEFADGRLVVLIDESSASASEIVAGAIQDWDRGVVIGRPSFGKGLVQRQLSLSDGSAIRLTIARYHTPSGRVIQRPYKQGKRDEYYREHYKKIGSIADTLHADKPRYKTLRTGRTVYGGGGITPDVITPIDTLGVTSYLAALIRRGVVNEFVVDYLDFQRHELTKRHDSLEKFATDFEVTDEMLEKLTLMATKQGIVFNEAEFALSKPILRTRLRALIAQKIFGIEAFYLIINGTDNVTYNTGVEIINHWDIRSTELLAGEK